MNLAPSTIRRNRKFLERLEEEFENNKEKYLTNPLGGPPEEQSNSLDGPPLVRDYSKVIYTPRDFVNELYRKATGLDPNRLTVLDLTNNSNTTSLDTIVSEEGELEVMSTSVNLSKSSIKHALSARKWDYILVDETAVMRQIFMDMTQTHRYFLAGVDIREAQPNATLIQVVNETDEPKFPFHIQYKKGSNYKGQLSKDYEDRVKDHVMNSIDMVQATLKLAQTDYTSPHIRPALFNAAYQIAQDLINVSAFDLAKEAKKRAIGQRKTGQR